MPMKNTVLAILLFLSFSVSNAKIQAQENPIVYDYLYIYNGEFDFREHWLVISNDSILEKHRLNLRFRSENPSLSFLTKTINKYEALGWVLFQFNERESGYFVIMRKPKTVNQEEED
jgi:penicillin-binding protein-related factor A (putative recombinase)